MTHPIAKLTCLFVLIPPSAVSANDDSQSSAGVRHGVRWGEVYSEIELPDGLSLVKSGEHGTVLRCEAVQGQPQVFPLVEIADPDITTTSYRLEGKIRYTNVSEAGYLEMWSDFGERGRYFTRTLEGLGPMAKIEGSTDAWTHFALPFRITDPSFPKPNKLEVNLVMPGGGELEITDLQLVEGEYGLTSWPGMAGAIGGCIGALFGILGGIYGWSRKSGKGWGVVKYFPVLCYASGSIAILLSIYWYTVGGYSEAAYVSGLLGLIILLVTLGNEWSLYRSRQARMAVAEERQMQALDVT